MPIYTYKCNNCDHQFDARQRFSDDPLTVCPQCDGRIRKVISAVSVVFKGSGFYVTDNRNGKGNGALNGNGKSRTDEPSTTDNKSDEKPKSVENVTTTTKPDSSNSATTTP